jgi:hypothetical protein
VYQAVLAGIVAVAAVVGSNGSTPAKATSTTSVFPSTVS